MITNNDLLAFLEHKKICIWGMGLEGKSTFSYLRKHFPTKMIYYVDSNQNIVVDDYSELLSTSDFNKVDLVFKSPGIVFNNECSIKQLTSQTSLFMEYFSTITIGITGSKGKSTTSSLMVKVLQDNGIDAHLVGNIGIPCFDVIDELHDDSKVVFEISAHQLQYIQHSPFIGVCLNIFQEHLDHYGTLEKYTEAKLNIFKFQHEDDVAIYNDALHCTSKGKHVVASLKGVGDIYIDETHIYASNLCVERRYLPLLGDHNAYNAAIVLYISQLLHVSTEGFIQSIQTFKALEHRLEQHVYNDVLYVNDSISTIPEATMMAVLSLKRVDFLLIGGKDRGISYDELIDFLVQSTIPHIYLMYETGLRIKQSVTDSRFVMVNTLEEAMDKVKQHCKTNDIVLLSPAAASYGVFKNFEHRGRVFKELAAR